MFTDDATRWRTIYFMAHKSDTGAKLTLFLAEVRRLTAGSRRVLAIRSDRGGEFIDASFQAPCAAHGITFQPAGPDAPQQNGVAERANRIIQDMMRCMREASGLGKQWWGEAANAAVYIVNRVPTRALDGDTPHHALLGAHASLGHLRVFGCRVYVQVPKTQRRKLDDRAWRGILVGFDPVNPTCYRVWNPETGRVLPCVHVTFDERSFPAKKHATFIEGPHTIDAAGVDVLASSPVGGIAQRDAAQEPATQPQADAVQEPSASVEAQQPERRSQRQAERRQQAAQQQHDQQAAQQRRDQPRGQQLVSERRSARLAQKTDRAEAQRPVGAVEPAEQAESQVDGAHVTSEEVAFAEAQRPVGAVEPAEQAESHVDGAHVTPEEVAFEEVAYAAAQLSGDPQTYKQAMRSPDAAKWQQDMDREVRALKENGVIKTTVLPPGAKVTGSRWHYKTKRDATGSVVRHKARLVAQGFTQIEGIYYVDTFAPVATTSSVRAVLALAAPEDLELHNMDVDTAFLQSPLDEVVYLRQPSGYEQFDPGGRRLVWRLHKSLYGLKQSSRNWHQTIDGWLCSYGFIPSGADPCVYVLREGKYVLIVVLYVDDLVIAGNQPSTIDRFKAAISVRFKMKDLGELRWILGMEVVRDRSKHTVELRQTAYVDRILERFGMADCSPVPTPAAEGVLKRLEVNSNNSCADSEFRCLVGSLLHAARVTRPDIMFAVQQLSRHLQAAEAEHWTAAKRVLRYLRGTRELGILYGGKVCVKRTRLVSYYARNLDTELVGYCDSDWGSDPATSRSTTGHAYMLAGGPVSWESRLQPTVALSSTEAEYMAACSAVQEAVHLRQLLADIGYEQEGPRTIYEDNQGCIALSGNPVVGKRSKHIAIRYHFTRERVESGEVKLVHVPTEHQYADLLTKSLARVKVERLRQQLHGYGFD